MKTIFRLPLLTGLLFLAFAGQSEAQHLRHLTFELGGSGGLASFNYERSFLEKEAITLHFRAGFSLAPVDRNNGTGLVFPLMVHSVLGKSRHKLDVGLGQALTITTAGSFWVRMPASFGYRLQPADKKYYFRIAYTPIISYLLDWQWEHWAGITYGYRINRKP